VIVQAMFMSNWVMSRQKELFQSAMYGQYRETFIANMRKDLRFDLKFHGK